MQTILFTVFPLSCAFGAFVYGLTNAVKAHRATGSHSGFFVPIVLLGFVLGRILDVTLPKPQGLHAWIDYQLGTRLARYETVLAAEVAILILCTAGLGFTLAWVLKTKEAQNGDRRLAVFKCLAAALMFAIGISARDTLAAHVTLFLARLHFLQ